METIQLEGLKETEGEYIMLARFLSIKLSAGSASNFTNVNNNGTCITYNFLIQYKKIRNCIRSYIMGRKIDLTGRKFGEWTVIKETANKSSSGNFKWLCRCSCGREFEVDGNALRGGYSTRCVHCVGKLRKTKYTGDPIKTVFMGMKQRCYNKNHRAYHHYGGRGISICNKWIDNPESFYAWAYKNGYGKGMSIDRIDNNKSYTPENCRFVPSSKQSRNRRTNHYITIDGVTDTLTGWCRRRGLKFTTVSSRIRRGMNEKDALKNNGGTA